MGFRRPKDRVPGRRPRRAPWPPSGPAVTKFAIGDEVYGIGRGTFAEYAVAQEDKLAHKPASLSFEQAAVVPISAGTALQALTDPAGSRPGQRVLVIGASGGVGSYAVQLAKALGAEVTGVASTGKLDLVRSLGADHVIDYTHDDFADGTQPLRPDPRHRRQPDLSRLRRALTPTGHRGARRRRGRRQPHRRHEPDAAGAACSRRSCGQRFAMFITKERASDLERLAELHRGRQGRRRPSTAPTRSTRSRRRCATSRPARCGARSPSPSSHPNGTVSRTLASRIPDTASTTTMTTTATPALGPPGAARHRVRHPGPAPGCGPPG